MNILFSYNIIIYYYHLLLLLLLLLFESKNDSLLFNSVSAKTITVEHRLLGAGYGS